MAVLTALKNQCIKIDQVLTNGINNPDRMALADCQSNPLSAAFLEALQPLVPFIHALIVVEEQKALDFIIQPLKQIFVEIVDANPCSFAMPAAACTDIYSIFQLLVFDLTASS